MKPRSPFIVASFYTPQYRECGHRLLSVLEALRIDYDVRQVPSRGSWLANCAIKPEVVLDVLRGDCGNNTVPQRPVVWLDADAFPNNRLPEIMRECEGFDFAAYMPRLDFVDGKQRFPRCDCNLMSGTMFFRPTLATKNLVREWLGYTRQSINSPHVSHLDKYDQETLWRAVKHKIGGGTFIRQLDPSFVCVPDLMPGVSAIVRHDQASRVLRDEVDNGG